MLRYQLLLKQALDPDRQPPLSLRDLARALQIPVPSLHNYVNFEVFPHIDNARKMATYFNEPLGSIFSEDDDLTARLVDRVRRLPAKRKKQLLQELA
jgi:transcriptional regulator with XRE-family HTH domain